MNSDHSYIGTNRRFFNFSGLNFVGVCDRKPDPDSWLTTSRFALLLMAFIVVSFPAVILGSQTFFDRDFLNFDYPLAYYYRTSFWRGEVPLWNPFNCYGLPFLAQWNTQTLYPPSLFYLVFSLSWSLGILGLMHLVWAGMGMYFLACYYTGSRLGAAFAGLAFGFNGLTWYFTSQPHILYTLAWMPWTLLTVELGWKNGGRSVVLAALVGAMQMLSGTPEIILFTWIVIGSLWLGELFNKANLRTRIIGRFLLIIALVTGLAAVQLLPFLDLLSHSQRRDVNFAASDWPLPVSGWANYFVPLFHEHLSPHGIFMQYGQFCLSSYYLGVSTVALAFLAIWRARNRRVMILTALTLYSLLLATGDQLLFYDGLRKLIPLTGLMRFPAKFVMLTTFVIPLLAAHGSAWLRLSQCGDSVKRKTIAVVALVVLAVIAGVAWFEFKYPEMGDNIRLTLWGALRRGVFLFFASSILFGMSKVMQRKELVFLGISVLVLLWMDVYTHAPNLAPTIDRKLLESDVLRHRFDVNAHLGPLELRVRETRDAFNAINHNWPKTPEEDLAVRRAGLFENLNLVEHVSNARGLYPLYLRDMDELNAESARSTNDLAPLLDFMGISYISDPENFTNWIPRITSMPLVSGGQQPVFADKSNTLRNITSPNFDPRRLIYLPLEARPGLREVHFSELKILTSALTAQRLDADVEASSQAVVAIAQAYYHCWRAYVDGKPTRLWKANYSFQALEVPVGRHHIHLEYDDLMFRWGAVTTVLTIMGLATYLVRSRRSEPSGTS